MALLTLKTHVKIQLTNSKKQLNSLQIIINIVKLYVLVIFLRI